MVSEEQIAAALRAVSDITGNGDIISAERVERIGISNNNVALTLKLPGNDSAQRARTESEARQSIKSLEGVGSVMIMTKGDETAAASSAQAAPRGGPGPSAGGNPFEGQSPIEGVKHIIAVSSAKGGVGKSTICVNLALALAARGARVGLLDADVYGPSLQVLLGVTRRPTAGSTKEVAPVVQDGLKLMSLAFISDPGQPVIWRGPIVMGVVRKFLQDVEWGELDYLMVDMPPGTGDTQLTMVQTVPLTGAIIVTTPSELSLVDAEKGLNMYHSVNAPVMGIVENMSYFLCPHCGDRTDIYGHGGGRSIAKRLKTDFLGELPLDASVRAAGDEGDPIVKRDPGSPVAKEFFAIADRIRARHPVDV